MTWIRIRDFFIQLFCKHEYDEFEYYDEEECRTVYAEVCLKCGKII